MNANHELNMKMFRDWWQERVDTGIDSPAVRVDQRPFTSGWPCFDVIENDNAYLVSAEVPGVDIDNVFLLVGAYDVTVRGRRPADTSKGRRICLEQLCGEFCRKLTLDEEVDREAASAALSHDILYISLPKTGRAANDRSEVNIESL